MKGDFILIIFLSMLSLVEGCKKENKELVVTDPGGPGIFLLGGQNAFCTQMPFNWNGDDSTMKMAAYLGMYKNGESPQFGSPGEAEIIADTSTGEIKVKFHPQTPYKANDPYLNPSPYFNNKYFLYTGLIPPWHQWQGTAFTGCGYDTLMLVSTGSQHLHFKGEFKWISSESNPPVGSGAGSTLFGGWLSYQFSGGGQEVVAFNNFSNPIGTVHPSSLSQASYECGDWWHNLSWADWWNENLNDVWYSFDIDVTAVHQRAVQVSLQECSSDNDLSQAQVYVLGLFAGPEYAVESGGPSVFMLRNFRTEIY